MFSSRRFGPRGRPVHDIRRYSPAARTANIARMKSNRDGPDENPAFRADTAVVSGKLMLVGCRDVIPTCIVGFPYYQIYAAADAVSVRQTGPLHAASTRPHFTLAPLPFS